MKMHRGDVVLYTGFDSYRLLGIILEGCVDADGETINLHTVRWVHAFQQPITDRDVIPRTETLGDIFMQRLGSLADHGIDVETDPLTW